MARQVLLDTGPIVAILCREDSQHERCVATLQQIDEELVTCWPVVTEAVHLLGGRIDRIRRLLAMFTIGAVRCVDLPPDAAVWLDGFFARYPDQSPDLADAALMLLADRDGVERIFTLDRRDFMIYRTTNGNALVVLPSEE